MRAPLFPRQTQLINISGRYSKKMLVDGFSASEMKLALEVNENNIADTDIWGYQYLKDTIKDITFKDMKIRHTWFVSVAFENVTFLGADMICFIKMKIQKIYFF